MSNGDVLDILLVEDSDEDAELIVRALRKSCLIHAPVRVRDGLQALEYVYREGEYQNRPGTLPELILLDLKMPRVDGHEVLRTLKSDALTSSIPIVVITASAQERDLLQSYKLGATGYLIKPVSFGAFAEAVTQAGLYWAIMRREANRIPSQPRTDTEI